MTTFFIASIVFWSAVLGDAATSEYLDDAPGASESNAAFRGAKGGHSVTRRIAWALAFYALACIGAYVQAHGFWPGALLWVAVLCYAGFGAVRGLWTNLRGLEK